MISNTFDKSALLQTAESIIETQLPSGMIPWFLGGHADPWNHTEAVMALTTAGFLEQAQNGFLWLSSCQRSDGSWHNYYLADGVEEYKVDTNCVGYIATGLWHYYLTTGDLPFVKKMFPCVQQAINFVLTLQTERGEILWAQKSSGEPFQYALLTACSSLYHSLGCAIALAELVTEPQSSWKQSHKLLQSVLQDTPEAFAKKDRWSMDWYYPVLSGALSQTEAHARILDKWDTYVLEGRGVRCVSDEPWVTAAESCECVMALLRVGLIEEAHKIFSWVQNLRSKNGSYFTGMVYPQETLFPAGETSTYTSAAVILAADALYGMTNASDLFSSDLSY